MNPTNEMENIGEINILAVSLFFGFRLINLNSLMPKLIYIDII